MRNIRNAPLRRAAEKGDRLRKIIIISSNNTGHGHTSITTSLLEQFTNYPDVEVKVVQGFRLISQAAQKASGLYGPMTRYSKDLWKVTYELSQQSPKRTNELTALAIHDNFMKLIAEEHPDMILTVHSLFAGSVINILEDYHLNIPHVTLIADMVDLHATWCEPRSDLTLCPTEEAMRVCRIRGCDPKRMIMCGFPSRRQFTDAARRFTRGDLPTDRPLRFLIMSGGEGSGSLKKYARELLDKFNCEVRVICGRNEKLRAMLTQTLKERYGDRVKVLGFVKDVETHMLECDMIIARGSPNSLMEAVVCNIPIICVGALPGQEEHNPQVMARHHLGVICQSPRQLPDVVNSLIANDGQRWRELRDGQLKYRNLDAAKDIVDILCARLKKLDYPTPIYKLKNPLLDYMESFRQLLHDDSKHKRYHRVKHNDDYFQQ